MNFRGPFKDETIYSAESYLWSNEELKMKLEP